MRALYSIKKNFFSYYTTAKSPSTTFLYLWGSFTTTSTFLSLSSSNTAVLLFSIQHHLHHISLFPPPQHTHMYTDTTSHFYCFPSTTSTAFRLFSLHHHLHHNSIVFCPLSSPPPHFYCFSSTTSNTFLWFLIRYIHHISILSLHHYLTTFLLFSIYHHDHLSVVFHPPP